DGIRDKLVTGVQTCALPISCTPNGRDIALGWTTAGKRTSLCTRSTTTFRSAAARNIARIVWLGGADALVRPPRVSAASPRRRTRASASPMDHCDHAAMRRPIEPSHDV